MTPDEAQDELHGLEQRRARLWPGFVRSFAGFAFTWFFLAGQDARWTLIVAACIAFGMTWFEREELAYSIAYVLHRIKYRGEHR